jgi:dTDP-4-amino-4,6-dideoxygalactose transaminase
MSDNPTARPFLAFGKPDFSDAEIAAVAGVLRSGWVGMGSETIAFERELGEFIGAEQVVSVSSCTAALFLSLVALNVGKGDEVICPSLTWFSTANAALYLGATPVLCDVDRDTLCVTPETVAAKVTAKTKVVIPVHFGGLTADIAALRAALPGRIAIVEDAAHALGSRYLDGTPVGASGNLVCFSFYANKNLSTGEGGAISLRDAGRADRLRSLRLHGLKGNDAWSRYTNPNHRAKIEVAELGYKMNFTDLQACIGRVQLRRQPEFAQRRRQIAHIYQEGLSQRCPGLAFQAGVLEDRHARHLFVVRLPLERLRVSRQDLINDLKARGVGVAVHYEPLHRSPLYQDTALAQGSVCEQIADRILTLPIGPAMSPDDAAYVVDTFATLYTQALRS